MTSDMSGTSPPSAAGAPTLAQQAFRRFCQLVVDVFYRRCETSGRRHVPTSGPLILCANHVNALVDAVVVQATCPRTIHPLARSGLFRNPLLRPILNGIEAVPIYRRHAGDPGGEQAADRNEDSFRQVYAHLGAGRAVLIFPEGQSHSDPTLRPLKTGAARLALGALEHNGALPTVVPVGLTFTRKGKFRGEVLVQYGRPVVLEAVAEEPREETARRFTAAIGQGLLGVTINADSWQDLAFLDQLQRFFEFRHGRVYRRRLARRVRSLQRLIETHRLLRVTHPGEVTLLMTKLERFERLRRRYGVRDYHLALHYDTGVVTRFLLRALGFALFVFPLALWGGLSSAIPYEATRRLSLATARGLDQYDTASILFGLGFFGLFWGLQTFAVYWWWGPWPAFAYAASLPITSAVALKVGKERQRILENVKVFWLFMRQREVQRYLRVKREELELELARLARLARRVRLGGGVA